MNNQCKQCQQQFEITDDDLKFYEKVSPVFNGKKYLIPAPTFCPKCRFIRRSSFRNLKNLFKNKCDFSKKNLLSMYSPNSGYKIYEAKIWESDSFDAMQYGRDFDFNRPFFEQFKELSLEVPRPHASILGDTMENSDYVNGANHTKNSYMCYNIAYCENCYYSEVIYNSKDCMDCLLIFGSENCYECLNVKSLYNCFWCRDCNNLSNSSFCIDCDMCEDCFGCVGLKNKKYHLWNEEYSKEEYKAKVKEINLRGDGLRQTFNKLNELNLKVPHKFAKLKNTDNVSGDYLENAKNTFNSFYCSDAENINYCLELYKGAKDCMDVSQFGQNLELCYEVSATGMNTSNILFSADCHTNSSNLIYCVFCYPSTKDCFGCIGMKRKQYCILNKQYTKEEYEELVPKIIEHMMNTSLTPLDRGESSEWGEFFPCGYTSIAYNETCTFDFVPLTKEKALEYGFRWNDELDNNEYSGNYMSFDDIDETFQDENKIKELLGAVLKCEKTGRPYRIIPQELAFYIKNGLPIPRKCPKARAQELINLKNPINIWDRNCMKCGKEIKTTYSPERKEIVYCEECYQKDVY